MRLGLDFDGDVLAGPSPRVGLVVAHPGWRRDLERALVSAGCRVVELGPAEALPCRTGIDVLVSDLEAAPRALGIDRSVKDRLAVWAPVDAGTPSASSAEVWELLPMPFSVADLERSLERVLAPARAAAGALDPVLVSREPGVEATLLRARRLAERDLDLVVEGELGVGRRALARATHEWSPRAGGPFVPLDRVELAAAAAGEAVDRIEQAWSEVGEGTLLAIEPGEWTAPAQHALAGMLRHGKGARVVTIVSEPLDAAVDRGRLAGELADRLDVSRVRLPALRARPADHRVLCEAIARRVARRLGRETPILDDATIAAWAEEGFPGNLLGIESRVRAAMLQEEVAAAVPGTALAVRRHDDETESLDLKRLERDTIVRALAHWQGNRTRASESLGISVRTLRNKIREYGLR